MKGPIINGEPYSLIVLIVTERDAFGRPKKADILYDEESVKVEQGMEFITAFVKERVVEPETKGAA